MNFITLRLRQRESFDGWPLEAGVEKAREREQEGRGGRGGEGLLLSWEKLRRGNFRRKSSKTKR